MFWDWAKLGAIEVNEHNTLALVVPEQVGIMLVTVVDTLGPYLLRGAVRLCRQVRRAYVRYLLPSLRHQHHVGDPCSTRKDIASRQLDHAQMHRHHLALKPVEPSIDTALMLQAAKITRQGSFADKCVAVRSQLQLEEHPYRPGLAPTVQSLAVFVRIPAQPLRGQLGMWAAHCRALTDSSSR